MYWSVFVHGSISMPFHKMPSHPACQKKQEQDNRAYGCQERCVFQEPGPVVFVCAVKERKAQHKEDIPEKGWGPCGEWFA